MRADKKKTDDSDAPKEKKIVKRKPKKAHKAAGDAKVRLSNSSLGSCP